MASEVGFCHFIIDVGNILVRAIDGPKIIQELTFSWHDGYSNQSVALRSTLLLWQRQNGRSHNHMEHHHLQLARHPS